MKLEQPSQTAVLDPTCLLTAALRAAESQRSNRLYADPLAQRLTDAIGRKFLGEIEALTPEPADSPCTVNFNAIRTRLFDDFLSEAVHTRGIRQVVLAAAGLDTRLWRMKWPSTVEWFELDRPAVLDYKREHLASEGTPPAYRAIPTDLTSDWVPLLAAAGFDPQQPTAWLVEGLLYYWREPEVLAFLARVGGTSAPGSVFAADFVNRVGVDPTHPATKTMAGIYERWGARWLFGVDDPEALLERYGFEARVVEPGDPDASFGRWRVKMPPRNIPGVPRAFFVFGEHKQ